MKTAGVKVSPALRALLGGIVDYAGLFPPAALALEPALGNYAAYLRSEEAWMLGCFVLPVAKLPETSGLLMGRFDAERPLRVSALGMKTNLADEFLDGLRGTLGTLADFQAAHGAAVAIEQLEAPLPVDTVPGHALSSLLREAASMIAEAPGSLRAFWEVPFSEDLPDLLRGFAEHNAGVFKPSSRASTPRFAPDGRMLFYSPVTHRSHRRPFGVKLRTGGMEAAAFPSPAQLAMALVAAHAAGVALKFTAGLHHPFRRFDAGVDTRMHGFMNVFTAGSLLRRPAAAAIVQAVLEDEDPASFRLDADGLHWRDWRVSAGEIPVVREWITSFGSCSFDEPRDDLRALGLLP